jgi:anti-sigma B factor antagonist/stage II sporulation protein AA (anti-sigma F factor antagonist)
LPADLQTVDVHTRQFGSVVVAKPSGRIDQSNAAAFEAALAPLWARADVAALLLDFTGVEYISSVGLRVLMIAARQMRGRKARIAVAGLQSVVAEIFSISRFNTVLEVFPTLRDALGALSGDALAAYDAA